MYDIFENECIDTKNFFTKYDIETLQRGDCDNHTWDLKRSVQVYMDQQNYFQEEATVPVTNELKEEGDPHEEKRYRRLTWEEFSHAVLVVS